MNKNAIEVKSFFDQFKKVYQKNVHQIAENVNFGFAVPSVFLSFLNKNKITSNMIIAAQNIHWEESGSYTGEISSKIIKSVGANAVIIGHSERRQHFGETNENVNKKLIISLKNKLIPIVCVGETIIERKENKWKTILETQMQTAFKNIDLNMFKKIIVAYEPIWAIGTGVSASPQQAQEACEFLRKIAKNIFFHKNDSNIIIQYGGSVNIDNFTDIIKQKNIDGVLVGKASLNPQSFFKLLTLAN